MEMYVEDLSENLEEVELETSPTKRKCFQIESPGTGKKNSNVETASRQESFMVYDEANYF
jgi:hypothetical protein